MVDAISRAREQRNLLERLGGKVPGFAGYLERELRREVDDRLRGRVAEILDQARQKVHAVIRELPLEAGGGIERLSRIEKALSGAAATVRHAGAGYAGLFDAYTINQAELEGLYRIDLELLERAERLCELAPAAGKAAEAQALEVAVEALRQRLLERPRAVRAAFTAGGGE